jgi:hypothetical protein
MLKLTMKMEVKNLRLRQSATIYVAHDVELITKGVGDPANGAKTSDLA